MIRVVQSELEQLRDPVKATNMQSYLKTDMPMYGLQKPERASVERKMHETLSIDSVDLYRECVQTLWELPYREEKYLAIDLALKYKEYITLDTLDLFVNMIREDYMWWDLCDPISIHLVGGIALHHDLHAKLSAWIRDDNMWIRRAAILAQLKHKHETDHVLLFDLCRQRMHEKEFFIRKAIGWALREYSKTDADAVIDFLNAEKSNLSGLSFREGAKALAKQGRM
jgi:3-methyladenine DNA glycosylase AlkD